MPLTYLPCAPAGLSDLVECLLPPCGYALHLLYHDDPSDLRSGQGIDPQTLHLRLQCSCWATVARGGFNWANGQRVTFRK